jgi:RNA polymerase sigma-70 factor, ECF subfamily
MSLPAERWTDVAHGLLGAARAGDAAALGQLMELFRGYLLAIAEGELSGEVKVKAGASDVVQDAFLEAQRLFTRFHGDKGDEFRAWLRAILLNKVNELHNRYQDVQKRQIDREQSLDDTGESGPLHGALPGTDSTPSGRAMRHEEEHQLAAALGRLEERTRQVIVWRNWDGLSFAEIGQRLSRSEDAARMLFGRALELLKTEMERPDERRPDGTG